MKVNIFKAKKYTDDRGWLAEVLKEDFISKPVKQIYLSFSRKGKIRGDHYHKRKTEWFSVIRGKAIIYLKDLNTGEEKEVTCSGENIQIIEIPPYIYHKVESLTEGMLLLAAVSELYKENDSDTYD